MARQGPTVSSLCRRNWCNGEKLWTPRWFCKLNWHSKRQASRHFGFFIVCKLNTLTGKCFLVNNIKCFYWSFSVTGNGGCNCSASVGGISGEATDLLQGETWNRKAVICVSSKTRIRDHLITRVLKWLISGFGVGFVTGYRHVLGIVGSHFQVWGQL